MWKILWQSIRRSIDLLWEKNQIHWQRFKKPLNSSLEDFLMNSTPDTFRAYILFSSISSWWKSRICTLCSWMVKLQCHQTITFNSTCLKVAQCCFLCRSFPQQYSSSKYVNRGLWSLTDVEWMLYLALLCRRALFRHVIWRLDIRAISVNV